MSFCVLSGDEKLPQEWWGTEEWEAEGWEQCAEHLAHYAEDGAACDIWQCQRPLGHVGRHHAWAIEASYEGGFDSPEVEIWWPNLQDPERRIGERSQDHGV